MLASKVFHLSEVRERIFYFKYNILYEKVNNARERLVKVNNKLCCNVEALMTPIKYSKHTKTEDPPEEPPGDTQEDEYVSEICKNPHAYIHSYSLDRALTWRESAVVLGLYYLLT